MNFIFVNESDAYFYLKINYYNNKHQEKKIYTNP